MENRGEEIILTGEIERSPRLPRIVGCVCALRANAVCANRYVKALIALTRCNDYIPLTGRENLTNNYCNQRFANR